MSVGGAALSTASVAAGGAARIATLSAGEWIGAVYLASAGGALAFALWVYALEYASPTRVTNTTTVNPLVAALGAAALLAEPLTLNLAVGLVCVFAGIWIATAEGSTAR